MVQAADAPGGIVPDLNFEQFSVLMSQFEDTIEVVARESGTVRSTLDSIQDSFRQVETHWQSPAEATFEPLASELRTHADGLNDLLDEIVRRMRATYGNYRETERRAQQNLTPHGTA
jgi:WXG100 family type VII secretion target